MKMSDRALVALCIAGVAGFWFGLSWLVLWVFG